MVIFMFKYVKIKNYKSLNDLYVDFSKTKSNIKKMIAIYGENGIGKSNFAEVFFSLHEILRTMSIKDIINQLLENSDDLKRKDINMIIHKRFKDIKTIISECKTPGSREEMVLEFGFCINGKNGNYLIAMDNKEITHESLEFTLNKNKVNLFTISKTAKKINENLFYDTNYEKEIKEQIERYWGKHAFLSILNYELEDKKYGFIKKRINSELLNILKFLNNISIRLKQGKRAEFNILGVSHEIFGQLENGSISCTKEKELHDTELLLNEFFCSLYSDIDSVYYRIIREGDNLKYSLYIRKKISNNIVDIDFKNESTGTQNLLDLLPFIIAALEGQVVVIDEFETGIHDLLVEAIVETLYSNIKGQLIFTTHNTRLLESQLPKNIMYILRYNNNNKELIPFDRDERIQQNNNLRKKYLSGYYNTYIKKEFSINKMMSLLEENVNINKNNIKKSKKS